MHPPLKQENVVQYHEWVLWLDAASVAGVLWKLWVGALPRVTQIMFHIWIVSFESLYTDMKHKIKDGSYRFCPVNHLSFRRRIPGYEPGGRGATPFGWSNSNYTWLVATVKWRSPKPRLVVRIHPCVQLQWILVINSPGFFFVTDFDDKVTLYKFFVIILGRFNIFS